MLARPQPFSRCFHFRLFTVILLLCTNLAFPSITSAQGQAPAKIAIVLDDLGYRSSDAAVFELPTQIAISVLPDTPFASKWSRQAHTEGRDVILHLPMESESQKRLGPMAITSDMYPYSIEQTLEEALNTVPFAIGVNNHMGSKLTAQTEPMNALMSALKKRNLLFIDSRTTPLSVAELVAKRKGLTTGRRHVFLDHVQSEAFITHQFEYLKSLASKRGQALAIAHPHPLTVEVLKRQLQALDSTQFELVNVSDYFRLNQENKTKVSQIAE